MNGVAFDELKGDLHVSVFRSYYGSRSVIFGLTKGGKGSMADDLRLWIATDAR